METVPQADESSLNIQNEYFNKARKNHTRITVVLTNGQRISGFIRSFDKFTVILDTRHGDQMVFKHAISTVAPSGQGDRDGRPPRPHQGDRRPGGFGRPSGGGRPRGGTDGSGSADGGSGSPQGGFRQRASASPSGKSFGNYMDLSAVSKTPASAGAKPEVQAAGKDSGPGAAPKPDVPAAVKDPGTGEAPKPDVQTAVKDPGSGEAPKPDVEAAGKASGSGTAPEHDAAPAGEVKKETPAASDGPEEPSKA